MKKTVHPSDVDTRHAGIRCEVALQVRVSQRHRLRRRIGVDSNENYAHVLSFPLTGSSQTNGIIP